ncbi:MAG: hypothetical protein NVSMB25_21880 [Thermoleophilaceae bacterium]
MSRSTLATVISIVVAVQLGAAGAALAAPAQLSAPGGLVASVGAREVNLSWQPAKFPTGVTNEAVVLRRDGATIATLGPAATSYSDRDVRPGGSYSYTIAITAARGRHALASPQSAPVSVALPAYMVGAASEDITPTGAVNLGGFGLGDGTVIPQAIIGRGGYGAASGEHIGARAVVFDDGRRTIAIATIETQGMFAAYEDGPYGLTDIAAQVAKDIPGVPADHILIATDHTHSGPDTIGAWGGVSNAYLKYIHDQAVTAIETAYRGRRLADVKAGHSDASDLIYNQACSEALNQSRQPTYSGPDACAVPGKDGAFRVVQAKDRSGAVVVTYAAYAAHATAGGGSGLNGDWPQFLSDAMTARYGGVGLAMEGANGGTQPCRPTCSFTKPTNPGYNVGDRKTAIVLNYMAHVQDSLASAAPVRGPVAAAQSHIREPITGPALLALFTAGSHTGTRLLRSHESPWVVGETIGTVTSALRVGGVLFAGTPGEGFPAIGEGVRSAVRGSQEVIQLGLANDQLGYLIAPLSYVPVIAAEVVVNDNIIFNVSPTIGDHVKCSDISLSLRIGFDGASPASCAPYDAADATGDPVGRVPVGGVQIP